MTKEELAAECHQIVASLYYALEEALEKSDGYMSATIMENTIRVLDGLNAIAEGDEEPDTFLPYEIGD